MTKFLKEPTRPTTTNRIPGCRYQTIASLHDYAGEYVHPGYGVLTVECRDEELVAIYNELELTFKHLHYDVFLAKANWCLPIYPRPSLLALTDRSARLHFHSRRS